MDDFFEVITSDAPLKPYDDWIIWGTDNPEGIVGTSGDDYINAKNGDDTVYGGNGIDRIWGGLGNDRLFGGLGDDDLHGMDGDDLLNGGSGIDRLYGWNGNDRLYGGSGGDWLHGNEGDDWLQGFAENANDKAWDKLTGGDGRDKFIIGTAAYGNHYDTHGDEDAARIEDFTEADEIILARGNYTFASATFDFDRENTSITAIYEGTELLAVIRGLNYHLGSITVEHRGSETILTKSPLVSGGVEDDVDIPTQNSFGFRP